MGVFKGTKQYYNYDVTDIVGQNIKNWLDYGLLEIGAYTPITTTGYASGYSILQQTYDPNFGNGKVFNGFGPSWCWESGVAIPSGLGDLFQVSGVYVNNQFYPKDTSGYFSHNIDYQNGRVIFDNNISGSGTVRCNYVIKDIAIYTDDSPQWKIILDEYINRYTEENNQSPSGISSVLKERRVWLPCVVIEVQDRTNSPLQLGGGEYNELAVVYHIFGERPFDVKRISDILNNQENKRFDLYDVNVAPYHFNFDGTLSQNSRTYPQLANVNNEYFWTFADIESSRGGSVNNEYGLFSSQIIQSVVVARYLNTY